MLKWPQYFPSCHTKSSSRYLYVSLFPSLTIEWHYLITAFSFSHLQDLQLLYTKVQVLNISYANSSTCYSLLQGQYKYLYTGTMLAYPMNFTKAQHYMPCFIPTYCLFVWKKETNKQKQYQKTQLLFKNEIVYFSLGCLNKYFIYFFSLLPSKAFNHLLHSE